MTPVQLHRWLTAVKKRVDEDSAISQFSSVYQLLEAAIEACRDVYEPDIVSSHGEEGW